MNQGNFMNIESITEEQYLSVLPKYQRDRISQLISLFEEEEILDKWLEAEGPLNNVQFGGNGNSKFLSKLKDEIKIQVNKFICGHSDLKKLDREYFNTSVQTVQLFIVYTISDYVAQIFSISVNLLLPVVVIILISIKKIGLSTYCEIAGFPKR